MSRITTASIHNIEAPVFELGDSGSDISESFRVGTNQGAGFIPLAPLSEATYKHLRFSTQAGTLALHDEPTLGIQFGDVELVDDFEDGDRIPVSDRWGRWQSRADELGSINVNFTTDAPQGQAALDLQSNGRGFIEATTTRDTLIEVKKFEITVYAEPGRIGDRQDAISVLLLDNSRRAGMVGMEISGNGNVGIFFDPEDSGIPTSNQTYKLEVIAQTEEVETWDILINGVKVGERRAAPIDQIQLQADGENFGGNWRGLFDDIKVWGDDVA